MTSSTADTARWPFGPMEDADLTEYVDFVLAEHAPRRFALFGVAQDRADAGVLGWGVAFDDAALLWVQPDDADADARPCYLQGHSAESIRDMLARRGEVRLAWADPLPEGHLPA